MEWIVRLVIFSICVTTLCRLSASTPYEKYVRFLGAVLMGAQLVGILLSVIGQNSTALWRQIEQEGIRMEADLYGGDAAKLEEHADQILQQLWSQSEGYWREQLEEGEEGNSETREGVKPIVIQVDIIDETEGAASDE